MSDELFRDLSFYARLRDAAPPTPSADGFSVATAPPGAWPTQHGSPGRTSRSGEPLVSDQVAVVWQAPLHQAARPEGLLVGGAFIVVSGEHARGVWSTDGRPGGQMKRGRGQGLLDGERSTLLAEADEGGLCTYPLPDATRDAFVVLARPQPYFDRGQLQGPGVVAMLSAKRSPLGPAPSAVVEIFRVRDWRAKSALEVAQGIEPLAGVVRESDGDVDMAAAPRGPVLVTSDGVRWCDWLLRPLAERRWPTMQAQAVSVGDDARARVTCTDGLASRLLIVAPDDTPMREVALPWAGDANWTPPLITSDGGTILTPPGHVWSLDPDGQLRWLTLRDPGESMGTLSSNGILLLAGTQLAAFTVGGQRHVLWQPPAPLMTPPILAQGRIYVASADTLFALEPR